MTEYNTRAAASSQMLALSSGPIQNSNNAFLPSYYDVAPNDSTPPAAGGGMSPHQSTVQAPLISIRRTVHASVEFDVPGGSVEGNHGPDIIYGSGEMNERGDLNGVAAGTGEAVAEGDEHYEQYMSGSSSSSIKRMKARSTSFDLFSKWGKKRGREREKEPGGLSRKVRKPLIKFKGEHIKTYVIIEIFEGRQIIQSWKCGDLVYYVNHLEELQQMYGESLSGFESFSPRIEAAGRGDAPGLPATRTDAPGLPATKTDAPGAPTTKTDAPDAPAIKTDGPGTSDTKTDGPGAPATRTDAPGAPATDGGGLPSRFHSTHTKRGYTMMHGHPNTRPQASQLTYRDLRQVFTDGSPVPSIEIRRNCLVICFPPLSSIIMRNRVFLLVVEDLNTDRLVASLEEMQLRFMGRHSEADRRKAEKTDVEMRAYGMMRYPDDEEPLNTPSYAASAMGISASRILPPFTVKLPGVALSSSRSGKSAQGTIKDTAAAKAKANENRKLPSNEVSAKRATAGDATTDTSSRLIVPKYAKLDRAGLPHISVSDMYGIPEASGGRGLDGNEPDDSGKPSAAAGGGGADAARDSLQQIKLPMEFAAFELLVSAAFELLHSDIMHLEKIFIRAKQNLENLSPLASEELHVLKNQVQLYADRVSLFDKAFEEIIANPEEMIRMELSRQQQQQQQQQLQTAASAIGGLLLPFGLSGSNEGGVFKVSPRRSMEYVDIEEADEPNPDLEILLEFFDQELEMFRQRVDQLMAKIDSSERLLLLKLSLSRNVLLRWEVASTMAGVGIGAGTLLSGIFGMNLASGFEDSKFVFNCVTITIAIFTIVYFVFIFFIVQTTKI